LACGSNGTVCSLCIIFRPAGRKMIHKELKMTASESSTIAICSIVV
jgi:hypothetical protein